MYKVKIPGTSKVIVLGLGEIACGEWVTITKDQAVAFERLHKYPLTAVTSFEVKKSTTKKEDD